MNINKMKLAIGALAVFLLLPATSQAYFTTSQSATQLTSETIIYTVTYKFGFNERELYMPIGAVRGLEATTDSPHTGFTLFDENQTALTAGLANGLVFTNSTDVEIKDNQYYLPAGRAAEFTLITFLTIPAAEQTENRELTLEMTRLPFTMVKDGTPIKSHLNPSELQYYRTPAITL